MRFRDFGGCLQPGHDRLLKSITTTPGSGWSIFRIASPYYVRSKSTRVGRFVVMPAMRKPVAPFLKARSSDVSRQDQAAIFS
jgi:hypothetical protein